MMNGSFSGSVRLLTGRGRSAIASIQITGDLTALDQPELLFRAANSKPIHEQSVDVLCFGVWGHPGEDVVVCRTGQETLEVTCHGGTAAVDRVLRDVANRGFAIESGTRRSGEACRAAPLSTALMHARTQRSAEILLEQSSGARERFIEGLSNLSRDDAHNAIEQALLWTEFGRHLVEPWNVVLCGRPNVGKSSLMIALAGFTRSIVSEQPGTTRDRVTLETAIDGWPVRITDTAGVRATEDPIEQEGVQQTLSAIEGADLVVVVLDGSEPLRPEDYKLLERKSRRRLVVVHKSDLPRAAGEWLSIEGDETDGRPHSRFVSSGPGGPDHNDPRRHFTNSSRETVEVSSVTGDGMENLLRAISAALVPRQPPAGQWIPVSEECLNWLRGLGNLGR